MVEESLERHVLSSKVKDLEGEMNCLNYTWTLDSEETNEREHPILKHVYFQDRLKAHVHPNSIACLCYCFEMHLLSNALFWLASTFDERCMTILKTTARETTFFHAWRKHKETVSKRPVRL